MGEDLEQLRQRLATEREGLVELVAMGEASFRGELALVQTNLGAVEAVMRQQDVQALGEVDHPPGRVVITDAPDEPLWLTFYPVDGKPVRAALSPEKAVSLATGLTAGALRRWPTKPA